MPPLEKDGFQRAIPANLVEPPKLTEQFGELVSRIDTPGLLDSADVTVERIEGALREAQEDDVLDSILAAENIFRNDMRALATTVAAERSWRSEQSFFEVPQQGQPDGTYANASPEEKNYLDALGRWEEEKARHPHMYIPRPHLMSS